jgi:hypothetical protein
VPVLELTFQNLAPLMLAMLAMLATATLSVPAAFADRKVLRAAQARGRFREPLRTSLVKDGIRRELMRVGKHLIAAAGIAFSFTSFGLLMTFPADGTSSGVMTVRNWCFAAISALMLLNTILDYQTRREATNP